MPQSQHNMYLDIISAIDKAFKSELISKDEAKKYTKVILEYCMSEIKQSYLEDKAEDTQLEN